MCLTCGWVACSGASAGRHARGDYEETDHPVVRRLETEWRWWEREHPEDLVATELAADGHFFGFAGQAKMTGLFDYVFVSADLRAVDEGRDAKGSIVGRIMDQAVDRGQAERDLLELQAVFNDDLVARAQHMAKEN